jgi:hypothetical protein
MQATALVRPAVRRAHRSGAVSHATTFRNAETRAELVLVTPGTLALPKVARLQAQGARIFVVGDNPVAMSLAELALPGATPLWINLRQSAEIGRLHRDIQALGLPDRLILAPASPAAVDTLAIMRIVLAFLPDLRAHGAGDITLLPRGAASAATLVSFAEGLRPGLGDGGVRIEVSAPA